MHEYLNKRSSRWKNRTRIAKKKKNERQGLQLLKNDAVERCGLHVEENEVDSSRKKLVLCEKEHGPVATGTGLSVQQINDNKGGRPTFRHR